MSRGGRPSARGARKRNLVGPYEVLASIERSGGVPDDVIESLKQPRPTNPRTSAASDAAAHAVQGASALLAHQGVEHELARERLGPSDPNPQEAIARETAWIISVTTAMKESAPRKTWCRHMKAADPKLMEIRTVAYLSAGVWLCIECAREADPNVFNANPWPEECDLCGFTIAAGRFNRSMFNVLGCVVQCTVCDTCAEFNRERRAA